MPKQRRIDDTPVPTRFTPQELVMIEDIRRHYDLPTRSAAVRRAVSIAHAAMEAFNVT